MHQENSPLVHREDVAPVSNLADTPTTSLTNGISNDKLVHPDQPNPSQEVQKDASARSPDLESCPTNSSCASTDCEDVAEDFAGILSAINLPALALAAVKSRIRVDSTTSLCGNDILTCTIQEEPTFGGSHAVWIVTFSDGVKWIARVPGCGTATFGDLEAQEMMERINVTRFLRAKTHIPVPEIFAWKANTSNAVGVPYTLEAFVEGSLLTERWSDELWSTAERRTKILTDLAEMMADLTAFKFDKVGAPCFDRDGNITGVGQIIERDIDGNEADRGESIWGKICEMGPYGSTKAYLNDYHDDPEVDSEGAKYLWAHHKLVQLAIESIPDWVDDEFAIGHSDFNLQNIFVDEEGNITGIIDWDHSTVLPRALSCARYPIWITVDWDPVKYGWGMEDVRDFDSPAQLLKYRQTYAAAFADAVNKLDAPGKKYTTRDTQVSQILEAIWFARDHDGIEGPWILMKLIDWAFHGNMPCTLNEYCDAYLNGEADDWTELIREAFRDMWHSEQKELEDYQAECKLFLEFIRPKD